MAINPYQASLGERDPVVALAETPDRVRAAVDRLGAAGLERSHAPGKWTAGRLLVHLAQSELAFTVRVRMALTTPNYVVQPFDQDAWMARESIADPKEALEAYLGMRRWSLALFRSLSAADRAIACRHPERGEITVEWILVALAGHELHHLAQLEQVASA